MMLNPDSNDDESFSPSEGVEQVFGNVGERWDTRSEHWIKTAKICQMVP